MINVHRENDALTLRISGKFNFSCYKEFQDAVAGPAPTRYVVDLSKADYIDSSALGMLLLVRERAQAAHRPVRLANCKGIVADVLKVANFGKLFAIG